MDMLLAQQQMAMAQQQMSGAKDQPSASSFSEVSQGGGDFASAILGGEGQDYKATLSQFCEKFCGRPLTAADIVFTVNKFGNEHQAICKLQCLGGQEVVGHLMRTVKEAEDSAAKMTIEAYKPQIEQLFKEAGIRPDKIDSKLETLKRQQEAIQAMQGKKAKTGGQPNELVVANNPAATPKMQINTLAMKIAGRLLEKGETIYESRQCTGGFQATVKLLCLPDEWKDQMWAGEVKPTRQAAEQSAAEICLRTLMSEPKLIEASKQKPQPQVVQQSAAKAKPMAMPGGKGNDNSWGGDGGDSWAGDDGGGGGWGMPAMMKMMFSMMMGKGGCGKGGCGGDKGGCGGDKGGGGGDGGFGGGSWNGPFGGGGVKGVGGKGQMMGKPAAGLAANAKFGSASPMLAFKGKGKGKGGSRERITQDPIYGEVQEWNGMHGWIKPGEELDPIDGKDHPRLYVQKADLSFGSVLDVGVLVQFHVYKDAASLHGAGAEDVSTL